MHFLATQASENAGHSCLTSTVGAIAPEGKILAGLIRQRLKTTLKQATSGVSQFGFVPGRGTEEAICNALAHMDEARNRSAQYQRIAGEGPEHCSVIIVQGPYNVLKNVPCAPMARVKAPWTVPRRCTCKLTAMPKEARLLRSTPLSVNTGTTPSAAAPRFEDAQIGELAWGIPHSPQAFLAAGVLPILGIDGLKNGNPVPSSWRLRKPRPRSQETQRGTRGSLRGSASDRGSWQAPHTGPA